ncbi:hypothetical protein BKA70DRAFT_1307154, partial [Coprinopsis sp. MPI-PUGE-AT-0042]
MDRLPPDTVLLVSFMTRSMNLPSELSPYLSVNTALPYHLKPILRAHRVQIASSIGRLDAEVDDLERVLDAKRRERDQYKQSPEENSQLQATIRSIRLEILGTIFGFVLGDEPFGIWQYRTYGYLSSVCAIWRDVLATAPDICRGLEVFIDRPPGQVSLSQGDGIRGFEDNLAPWVAIVSRNHPYHLILGVDNLINFSDAIDIVADLAHWILSTVPSPTILSVDHSEIFSLLGLLAPPDNKVSDLKLCFSEEVDRIELQEVAFEEIFPCLEKLVIDAPIDFSSSMGHTNLQALTLSEVYGYAHDFSCWLMQMPKLRELRIGCSQLYSLYKGSTSPVPLIHSAVEILVVRGEDLMLLLEFLAFPSLKLLALNAWGTFDDMEDLEDIIPAFLQRSCRGKHTFAASFKGKPSKSTFDLFIRNLPLHTRLHYALDGFKIDDEDEEGDRNQGVPCSLIPHHSHHIPEIFFTEESNHLPWLRGDPSHLPGSEPIKLYLPMGTLKEADFKMRRKELRDWGYVLEILQTDVFTQLFRSLIPPFTFEWSLWAGASF